MRYNNSINVSKYEGLENMLRRWESLSENLRAAKKNVPILLPDIFLISKSGTGRTKFLKFLAEYLNSKPNLMTFTGDVAWFEFKLEYCHPESQFTEIRRFMNEVRNAAGFRNEYRGIVYIDIDSWKKHFEEKYFIDFLECLSDNSSHWLIVLSVSPSDDERIKRMRAVISCFLRLENITIIPPTTSDLLEFANTILGSYGVYLLEDAEKMLSETIESLCQNAHFDWYKSVKMLCQNIVYTCYAQGSVVKESLTVDDLLLFGKQSDYVEQEKKKRAKIGF